MDEISQDVGADLHTESLLLRAEQLARLESDKLVDKVYIFCCSSEKCSVLWFIEVNFLM